MPSDEALRRARLELVEEHVAFENRHDLDGVISTFGDAPQYEDTAWGERHSGRAAVRGHYEALMAAAPDLHIDIRRRHAADEVIVLECVISGTHLGAWRGLPPTGRRLEFPLCAVYTFDDRERLAGERIYYDRAMVLRQLGVLHEPDTLAGRLATAITHPVTLGKAVAAQARRRVAALRS
jgi:steroid delta-isomerase-like uncharacterized protein